MTFWKVLLIILLVLWLISLIRIGGRVSYGEAGLFAAALAGPFRIQILPAKPKKKKPGKKPKKEKPPVAEKHKKEPEEGQPGALSRLMKLLPVVGQACGALKRKIRIDDLDLELIWGGSDPAAIALGYGQANAVLGMIWPIFDHNFKVKHHSFQIGLDYDRPAPAVEVRAAVTLTVGQIFALGIRYGVKVLITWVKSGKTHRKKQEALSHE
mgnify:CR=1 FL=1